MTADRDRDGVPDAVDNCPDLSNTDQDDLDEDARGDRCDADLDGDGIDSEFDNCPTVANRPQADRNGDGVGDECQPDFDGDGVPDDVDNCLFALIGSSANPDQRDTDGDGLGDRCDFDDDGDAVADVLDACPVAVSLACSTDRDGDGIADAEDLLPAPNLPSLPIRFPPAPGKNDAPVAIGFATALEENQSAMVIGLVLVSDPDTGDAYTFAFASGNGAGLFGIDSNSGVITVLQPLDFESAAAHQLIIEVTDTGGLSSTALVGVSVLDRNEPPAVGGFAATLLENLPPTWLGQVIASDPDAGETFTYSIRSGNSAGLFAIDSTTGVVSTTGPLDYETERRHIFDVFAMDSGGLEDGGRVRVDVLDAPDPPPPGNAVVFDFAATPAGTPTGIFAGQPPVITGSISYDVDLVDSQLSNPELDAFGVTATGPAQAMRFVLVHGTAVADTVDNPTHLLSLRDGRELTSGIAFNEDTWSFRSWPSIGPGVVRAEIFLRDVVAQPGESDAVLAGSAGLVGILPLQPPNVGAFNCNGDGNPPIPGIQFGCAGNQVVVYAADGSEAGRLFFRVDSIVRRPMP